MNQHVRFFEPAPIQEPSADLRIPLAKIGPSRCRYIVGEPSAEALCCGAPTDGKSWCTWHRRLVFEPRQLGRVR